jgi:hypothetical protein
MKSKWVVRLGLEWQRHTQSRSVGESLRMLGSVQRGAQVGALAVDGNGRLLPDQRRVRCAAQQAPDCEAIKAAQGRAQSRYEPPRPRTASAPIVTVRRSRLAGSVLPPNPASAGD